MKINRDTIGAIYTNILGWHTKRHIIVFESDDWGAIRMPSRATLGFLKEQGVKIGDKYGYDLNDTLASNDDLELLMEVLSSVKDKEGHPAKITLNTCVANPDFKKIKENGFQDYYYEPFYETLKRYPNHDRSFELWKEGMHHSIFKPQFHGREHLNANMWMQLLKANASTVRIAFDRGVYSMDVAIKGDPRSHVMAAYNVLKQEDYKFACVSIEEGLNLFEKIFGFRSLSMIAPCYTWDEEIEDEAYRCGVAIIQGGRVQRPSAYSKAKGLSVKRHFTGQKNKNGQIYMVRSCNFEPTQGHVFNADNCMKEIERDFMMRKPAIVSCHRLNFIGGLNHTNRDSNLLDFRKLLHMIVKKYPDVEFLSSDELGSIIINQ